MAAGGMLQPLQRLFLYLTDPFFGELVAITDLFERHRALSVQSKAVLYDIRFFTAQGTKHNVDILAKGAVDCQFLRGFLPLVLDKVAQDRGIFLVVDRRIEGNHIPGDVNQVCYVAVSYTHLTLPTTPYV